MYIIQFWVKFHVIRLREKADSSSQKVLCEYFKSHYVTVIVAVLHMTHRLPWFPTLICSLVSLIPVCCVFSLIPICCVVSLIALYCVCLLIPIWCVVSLIALYCVSSLIPIRCVSFVYFSFSYYFAHSNMLIFSLISVCDRYVQDMYVQDMYVQG